jgi:pimeloyl-ACP methyl ester carboxylesterase
VDPDTFRNFTQIVQAKGYPCETHKVLTEDGYYLTVFRIPHGVNKTKENAGLPRPPVLLQHGFGSSSFAWILNWPYEALPYILADAGFDVFMGNNRGNIYSLAHTHYSSDDPRFWDFSWDEMVKYDVPALINYIKKLTGQPKLSYVGHSEGNTIMFAANTIFPSLYTSLDIFVALAPVTTMKYVESVGLKLLAEYDAGQLLLDFGVHEFPPGFSNAELQAVLYWFCKNNPYVCYDLETFIAGPVAGPTNSSRDPVFATHNPGGTSVKNAIHWSQAINSGKFQMYDYGSDNPKKYNGSLTPPVYPLSKFPAGLPVALFSGLQDVLADPTDVTNLYHILSNIRPPYWNIQPEYAHRDFVANIEAFHQIYNIIVDLIKKQTSFL